MEPLNPDKRRRLIIRRTKITSQIKNRYQQNVYRKIPFYNGSNRPQLQSVDWVPHRQSLYEISVALDIYLNNTSKANFIFILIMCERSCTCEVE